MRAAAAAAKQTKNFKEHEKGSNASRKEVQSISKMPENWTLFAQRKRQHSPARALFITSIKFQSWNLTRFSRSKQLKCKQRDLLPLCEAALVAELLIEVALNVEMSTS